MSANSPCESTKGRNNNTCQTQRSFLSILVKENFDTTLNFFQLIFTNRYSDSFLFQAFHLSNKSAVDVCCVPLQGHLSGRDELTHSCGWLGCILNFISFKKRKRCLKREFIPYKILTKTRLTTVFDTQNFEEQKSLFPFYRKGLKSKSNF